jgi:PAS domain-containing protein
MSQGSIRQTTLRLPDDLHEKIAEAASIARVSRESFIRRAIERELALSYVDSPPPPTAWNELLAHRFLECLPTPAVIKDDEFRILWCNLAYEDIFGRPRSWLLNRGIDELGLEPESAALVEKDMRRLAKSRSAPPFQFWEPVSIPHQRGAVSIFRTYRFQIRLPKSLIFFGDVSFDWIRMRPGYPQPFAEDFLLRLNGAATSEGIARLFIPFLSTCPAAMAVKNRDRRLLWCNPEYEKLAGRELKALSGLRTEEIFSLPDHHDIIQNEETTLRNRTWMYSVEQLPNRGPRTSLRFPMPGNTMQASFMGVVSAEFRQMDLRSPTSRPAPPPRK